MYGGNPENKYLNGIQAGTEFEEGFVFTLKRVFKDSKVYKIQNLTKSEDDIERGTDFMVGEIRIDPTSNFNNKDNMPFITDTGIMASCGQTWQMGVRHGNKHNGYTEFEEPVVVIGINMDAKQYRANEDAILRSLEKNAEDLIMKADDCLLDYTTTNEKERADLYETPLVKNPNYKEPKNISKRYKAYNNIRRFMNEDNNKQVAVATQFEM